MAETRVRNEATAPSPSTSSTQPLRTTPLPGRGPRYAGNELEYLREALASDDLFYRRSGGYVERMLDRARQEIGGRYAVAASSGTAAIHVALAAAGVEPGAEVITSPITDIGTVVGILYQNAIPVFCDLDPHSYNMTAKHIEAVITERTQAVLLVHLAGVAADMDPIVELCRRRNLKLIEDCAQSYGCYDKGRHVGTIGDVGCFSLNTYKHLSCGDGGFLVTDDEALYKFAHNWADKFYDRLGQGNRLHALGINYRMTELQGAVGLAQCERFGDFVEARRVLGDRLSAGIAGLPGVHAHAVRPESQASYWFYMFRVDEAVLGISRGEFVDRLQKDGIPAGGGYLAEPLYKAPLFLKKSFFPGGVWPAELVAGRTYDYSQIHLPNAEAILRTSIRLPLHERMSEQDVDDMAAAIRKAAGA